MNENGNENAYGIDRLRLPGVEAGWQPNRQCKVEKDARPLESLSYPTLDLLSTDVPDSCVYCYGQVYYIYAMERLSRIYFLRIYSYNTNHLRELHHCWLLHAK
jgi:hypothetical protein